MNVLLKGANGYERKEFTDQELVSWFEEHSKDGIVTDDIVLFHNAQVKSGTDGVEFVFSDMSLDADLERVDPTGWDLKEYKANPVILWQHNWTIPAIGKATRVRKSDKDLSGTVVFDREDPFAALIEHKVRSGFITKGSVGMKPTKIEIIDDKKDPTRLIHREQKLIEFSVVNLPANINATVVNSLVQDEPVMYNEFVEEERETSEPDQTSPAQECKTSTLDDFFHTQPIEELFK